MESTWDTTAYEDTFNTLFYFIWKTIWDLKVFKD